MSTRKKDNPKGESTFEENTVVKKVDPKVKDVDKNILAKKAVCKRKVSNVKKTEETKVRIPKEVVKKRSASVVATKRDFEEEVRWADPSAVLIHENDPFKKIELAGRTCYKSEDAITKESSKKFVTGLMYRQHWAMIEHAVLVFELSCEKGHERMLDEYIFKHLMEEDNFLYVTINPEASRVLVSGNIRAIIQRNEIDPIYRALIESYPEFRVVDDKLNMYPFVSAKIVDIKKMKDLAEYEFETHFNLTCKFVTDRGVTHEIVRHRRFSFAQESTRYCNYSSSKFDSRLTFCKPSTFDLWTSSQKTQFCRELLNIEKVYNNLTTGSKSCLSPQQARAVLPNCLKTEIVVTGPVFEWKHFFNLRSIGTTGAPHPDMKAVADIARKKMNKYIGSLKYSFRFKF